MSIMLPSEWEIAGERSITDEGGHRAKHFIVLNTARAKITFHFNLAFIIGKTYLPSSVIYLHSGIKVLKYNKIWQILVVGCIQSPDFSIDSNSQINIMYEYIVYSGLPKY